MKTFKHLILIAHLVFWLGYFLILATFSQAVIPLDQAIARSLIIIAMNIALFYCNSEILVPRLLEKKKYGLFFTIIFISILSISLVRFFFVENYFYSPNLVLQRLKDNVLIKTIFLSFSTIIIWIISTIYALSEKRWKLQQEQKDAELKLLKAQINPHFLFNTLNNIYALACEKSDKTAPMILHLAEMMRYAYHDCETEKIALDKEVKYIRNFIELYQLRFEHGRNISFELTGNTEGIKIAPLLFNPLLENVIKYSDMDYNENGFIHIALSVTEKRKLTFSMLNSFEKNEPRIVSGTGLKNLSRRLELTYPGRFSIHTRAENKQYSITLEIQAEP